MPLPSLSRHMQLWPTDVHIHVWDDPEFDARLTKLILANSPEFSEGEEMRVYDILHLDAPEISVVRERAMWAVQGFLGPEADGTYEDIELTGRAVVIHDRGFIQTHNEAREADLTVAYWPTGDVRGVPWSYGGNPRFVVEDPSRSLNDLRLPKEMRHSIHITPRPGTLLVMPAHIRHHQQPYRGVSPHLQIVCNVRVRFTDEYFRNKW